MHVSDVSVSVVGKGNVLAYADVVLDNAFAVHGIRVVKTTSGLKVVMPRRRRNTKNGLVWKDVAHPLNRELREEITAKVLAEYKSRS